MTANVLFKVLGRRQVHGSATIWLEVYCGVLEPGKMGKEAVPNHFNNSFGGTMLLSIEAPHKPNAQCIDFKLSEVRSEHTTFLSHVLCEPAINYLLQHCHDAVKQHAIENGREGALHILCTISTSLQHDPALDALPNHTEIWDAAVTCKHSQSVELSCLRTQQQH